MTAFTWKTGTGFWTLNTNWTPTGVPGTHTTDTAVVNKGSTDLNSTSETIAALSIGAAGEVEIDGVLGNINGALTVTGTLTNSGGPFDTHGLVIGNASDTGDTTFVSVGTLSNATSTSAIDVQSGELLVKGNGTNDGKDTSTAGLSVENSGTQINTDGSFTNNGAIAVSNGAEFNVTGTLTNNGGVANGVGLLVGSSSSASQSFAEIGSLINGTAGAIDVSNGRLTVLNNVTNNATGDATKAGFGVAFLSSNSDVTGALTVDGTFTNNGNFGIGNSGITGPVSATVQVLKNGAAGTVLVTGGSTTDHATLVVNTSAMTTNSGSIDAENGGEIFTSGNLTNSNRLGLDFVDPSSAASGLNVNAGAGTLTNTGTGTNKGLAILGGSDVAAATVVNSGTMFGNGIVTGDVMNSGTVAGGNLTSGSVTAGTLEIRGSYTQTSASKFIEIVTGSASGDAGELLVDDAVNSEAQLNGGAFTLQNSSTLTVGEHIIVLQADSKSLAGTFSSINGVTGQVDSNIGGGLGLVLSYDYSTGAVSLNVMNQGVTDTWNGGSGDWSTSGDWTTRTPGTPTDEADSAVISKGQVTLSNTDGDQSIASLTTGAFSKTTNEAGYLVLQDDTLTVSNNVTNAGGINLDETDGGSDFTVLGTLTNSGDLGSHTGIDIGNSAGNGSTKASFGNLVNTSTGGLDIDNARVIVTGNLTNSANNPTNFEGLGLAYFASNPSTVNNGVADIGGTLTVDDTFTNNGSFGVGNVNMTELASATVATLVNGSAGQIGLTGNASNALGFARLAVSGGSNAGLIKVTDNGALFLGGLTAVGTFTNSGTISLNGSSSNAYLQIADGGLNLAGSGKITMANDAAIITAPDAALDAVVDGGVTPTSGDQITLTFNNSTLGITNEAVSYTVASGDTATDVAEGLAAAIDSDSTLTDQSIVAKYLDNDLYIKERGADGNSTTVTFSQTGGTGTETVTTESEVPLNNTSLSGGGDPTFTNSNTISGSGTIGDQYMTLDNKGAIDANTDRELTIDTGSNTITNSGTLESTSDGGLFIGDSGMSPVESFVTNSNTIKASGTDAYVEFDNATVTNATGVIVASGTDADVGLFQSTIIGGKLESSGIGAAISTYIGDTKSELDSVTITAGTTVAVGEAIQDAHDALSLAGAIGNSGTILVTAPSGWSSKLEIDGTVILSGGGKITLSNNSDNEIVSNGSPATLTNDNNTISGAGTIGDSNLTFDNEGVVDADDSNALTLANALTNSGTLEATNPGSLGFDGNVTNTGTIQAVTGGTVALGGTSILSTSTAGLILASGTNAEVELNGSTIDDQKLQTKSGGKIFTVGNAELENSTIVAGSTFDVASSTNVTLAGSTISNAGEIELTAGGFSTSLEISGSASLTGAGMIVLSTDGFSAIASAAAGASFTTTNTISGAGTIGDANMASLINEGVIDANASAALTLSLDGFIFNSGTLEATGAGVLDLNSSVTNTGTIEALTGGTVTISETVTGSGAKDVVLASGAGAIVELEGALASLMSSKLETTGGGAIEVTGDLGSSIDGGSIVTGSTVEVTSGSALELVGDIVNDGTIELQGLPGGIHDSATLSIVDSVDLTGTGTITLSSNGDSSLAADTTGAGLTSSNTISGAGAVGSGMASLTNEGVIDANASNALVLSIEPGDVISNSGTLEATGTGGLQIDNNVTGSGQIIASGTDREVVLNGVTVTGGTLKTSGTGAVIGLDNGNNTLTNVTIAASTVIDVSGTSTNLIVSGGSAGAGAVIELGVSNDTADLKSASSIGVSFTANGNGSTLELDAVKTTAPHAYMGTISGFGVGAGGVAHADTSEYILLDGVNYDTGQMSDVYTPNSSNTGGVLTIKDGTAVVATLNFSGKYTTDNFQVTSDFGIVQITDPGASSGLANIGLLSNYIAAGTGSDHAASSTPATPISSTQPPDLATHHA